MCQVCLLHCPPSTICLKIIAAVVIVGGAAAVIALFSFLLLLLLYLYCAALFGIFCQVHIWDGSKRPKNNCAALIKKLNSAQGRGPLGGGCEVDDFKSDFGVNLGQLASTLGGLVANVVSCQPATACPISI